MPTALPPEIVPNILSRLPVKSLLRFRCTSKPWCSLIDGPDFTKLHLNRSTRTISNQSVVLWVAGGPIFSLDLQSLEPSVEIDHPLKTPKYRTEVIGSCNGLLGLRDSDSDSDIVILNISTRKHLRLPAASLPDPTTHHIAYGFGYDSVHDDYKLVRLVQFGPHFDSEVMVYSLKSNSWKSLGAFPFLLPYTGMRLARSAGVFACGTLFWVGTPKEDRMTCVTIAFDLASEQYRVLPKLPKPSKAKISMAFGAFEGRLSATCLNHDAGRADAWVLTNYGTKDESWTKLLSIDQLELLQSTHHVMPLALLGQGNEALLLMEFQWLCHYDLQGKKVIKSFYFDGIVVSFNALVYVESLVNPLPASNEDDGKQDNGRNKENERSEDDYLVKRVQADFVSNGRKKVLVSSCSSKIDE